MSFAPCNGTFAGSARQLLRAKTAADHANVDARFSALVGEGTAGYGEFLRLSAAAIYPLERALTEGNVERLLPDWQERSRRAALRADLADLGIDDPPLIRLPALDDEANQFGALYVLEGSRLGARVLVRKLLAAPTQRPQSALRYLRHGECLPLWQTFLERLESSAAIRRSPTGAITGARIAFACFGIDETARPMRAVSGMGS